jgi:hypothetical protein
MGKIEAGQAALYESKSLRIVVDEGRCLRAVCGNGAALLFERLWINSDPEPTDRIHLSRGRKRMSPDDILEQSEFPDTTLNRAGDPVGRLMVAMGIVSPADEYGLSAGLLDKADNLANRAPGIFAFMRDKAIGETKEEQIFWFQPELRYGLSCLLLAECRSRSGG